MHPDLTALGVPEELQAYFNISDLVFDYGGASEYFSPQYHIVPAVNGIWLAGNDAAKEMIITSSVMEAVAFASLNRHHYPVLSALSFAAIGNLPHPAQLRWIRANCQKRKLTLVFGKELTGRLDDIAVASGIRDKPVRLYWMQGRVRITANERQFDADPDLLTLNSFEKAAGLRMGIRTCKPRHFDTFLKQLLHDNS